MDGLTNSKPLTPAQGKLAGEITSHLQRTSMIGRAWSTLTTGMTDGKMRKIFADRRNAGVAEEVHANILRHMELPGKSASRHLHTILAKVTAAAQEAVTHQKNPVPRLEKKASGEQEKFSTQQEVAKVKEKVAEPLNSDRVRIQNALQNKISGLEQKNLLDLLDKAEKMGVINKGAVAYALESGFIQNKAEISNLYEAISQAMYRLQTAPNADKSILFSTCAGELTSDNQIVLYKEGQEQGLQYFNLSNGADGSDVPSYSNLLKGTQQAQEIKMRGLMAFVNQMQGTKESKVTSEAVTAKVNVKVAESPADGRVRLQKALQNKISQLEQKNLLDLLDKAEKKGVINKDAVVYALESGFIQNKAEISNLYEAISQAMHRLETAPTADKSLIFSTCAAEITSDRQIILYKNGQELEYFNLSNGINGVGVPSHSNFLKGTQQTQDIKMRGLMAFIRRLA